MVRDSSGRRLAHIRSSTGKKITLNDRDLMWLGKLARHGPLPTSYLLAFSAGMRESQKREKERLGDLFHENNTPYNAAYIDRPAQQFATMKAGYNQIVHAISKAGHKALYEAGLEEPHLIHRGPWVHRLMVACSTASIELATLKRQDITFIPQSAILTRAKVELRCPVTIETAPGISRTKDLVPDAVFGLQYHTTAGDRFRFFVLEADRATEPASSRNWNRKSFMRHLAQYRAYIEEGAYKQHLNLTAPLLVLNVVPDQKRLDLMLRQVENQLGGSTYQLFQTFPEFAPPWRPPEPHVGLLDGDWARCGLEGFCVGEV